MKSALVLALMCTLALLVAVASVYLSFSWAAACGAATSVGQQSPAAGAPDPGLEEKADQIIAEIRAMRAEVAQRQADKEGNK